MIDEVRLRTKRNVVPADLLRERFRRSALHLHEQARQAQELEGADGESPEPPGALDASIIEIVDSAPTDAIGMKASTSTSAVRRHAADRCRVDGVLDDLREYSSDLQAGVLSRL